MRRQGRGDTDRATPLLADSRASAEKFGMRAVVAQIDELTSGALFT